MVEDAGAAAADVAGGAAAAGPPAGDAAAKRSRPGSTPAEEAPRGVSGGRRRESRKRWYTEGDLRAELEMQRKLPAPMLGPALMKLPVPNLRELTEHSSCSLDAWARSTLKCEPGLGVQLDLIGPSGGLEDEELQAQQGPAVLAPEDEALLALVFAEKKAAPEGATAKLLSGAHNPRAPSAKKEAPVWLKNTVYLSNNLHEQAHSFKSGSKERAEAVDKVRQAARERANRDVSERLRAVEASFRAASALDGAALKHATDPSLTAEFVLPVHPDQDLWANEYFYLTLDREPDVDREPDDDNNNADAGGNDAGDDKQNHHQQRAPTERALVSRVLPTSKKIRTGYALSTSLSLPKPAAQDNGPEGGQDFEWVRQYQLSISDVTYADRLFLFLDPETGRATYTVENSKRLELE